MNIWLSVFGLCNFDRSDLTKITSAPSDRKPSRFFQLRSGGRNESRHSKQTARTDRGGDHDIPAGDWRKA